MAPPPKRDSLTERQREVLTLVEANVDKKEIASQLGIGVNAIDDHIRRLRKRGFLPRTRRRRGRQSETRVEGAGARTGGNGMYEFDGVPSLGKAIAEIDQKVEANDKRLAELNEEQSRVAQDTNRLGKVRSGIEEAVKA